MENTLKEKSKQFSIKTIKLCRKLKESKTEYPLIDQLLRSATSVGANIYEAHYAQGTKDFISKLEIALKECNETDYWFELLYYTDCVAKEDYDQAQKDIIALRRMLVSAIKKSKEKIQ